MTYRHLPVPELDDIPRYLDQELTSIENTIDRLISAINELVIAGYGGGVQVANLAYDIPALTYITLPIDTLVPAVQRGMVTDLVNDTISFKVEGVWRLSVSFNIENITELNASRTFSVRPYNVTQGIPDAPVVVPVSRNQGDIYFITTVLLDNLVQGDEYRIEIGGGDAISGGTLIEAQIQANNVTELGELINR